MRTNGFGMRMADWDTCRQGNGHLGWGAGFRINFAIYSARATPRPPLEGS